MPAPRHCLALALALAGSMLHAEPVVLLGAETGAQGPGYLDVPPAVLASEHWLGLYVDGGQASGPAQLLAARVAWHRLPDAPPLSVHAVEVAPAGPRLLLSGVPGVQPGRATSLGEGFPLGEDLRQARFDLDGRTWQVVLTSARQDLCDAVVTLASGARTQTLFDLGVPDPREPFDCDDPHFEIHWAGDLDGDGRLDLLVNFSRKYSLHPRVLLLSSAARGDDFVGEAARYVLSD